MTYNWLEYCILATSPVIFLDKKGIKGGNISTFFPFPCRNSHFYLLLVLIPYFYDTSFLLMLYFHDFQSEEVPIWFG